MEIRLLKRLSVCMGWFEVNETRYFWLNPIGLGM